MPTLPPPLIKYNEISKYRSHYERVYCQKPIMTFDGIPVVFRKNQFDHVFFESSQRNTVKDTFSRHRAERIDWIKATLKEKDAELYQGWDRKKAKLDNTRRVAVAYEDYVVVVKLKIKGAHKIGEFVTAYKADNSIGKIKRNPRWP